jgi:hypothetical protein
MQDRISHFEPLRRGERWGVGLLLVAFLLFGAIVEIRSAFLKRRMTDLNCYLRAAWALRQGGADLYNVFDDNGWHYNYPPLLAIVLTPLADPPCRDMALTAGTLTSLAGAPLAPGPLLAASTLPAARVPFYPDLLPRIPYVPWKYSVAIFYVLNILLLALAIHLLASALEATIGVRSGWRQPRWSRRWFALRLVPLGAVLVPTFHTLVRGQANLLLMVLLCGLIASLVRGHSVRAGLFLAGAICLKIFPAFLLVVPIIRGDRRCVAGCAAGLLVGLVLIPVLALGPGTTLSCYRDLAEATLGPALGLGGNSSRAHELTMVTSTDSQSIQAAIHNTLYLRPDSRPRDVSALVRKLHWLIGGGLTLVALAAGWRQRHAGGPAVVLLVGALVINMLLLSPVCHMHYFCLALPLVMGLLARQWEREVAAGADMGTTRVGGSLLLLIGLLYAGFVPPVLPGCQVPKDACLMSYTTLVLWLVACWTLWRWPPAGPLKRARGEYPLAA